MAQMTKNLPAMWETQTQSLGREDTLEKGMATHSRYSCLENSMGKGYNRWGLKESDMTEQLRFPWVLDAVTVFF